MGLHTQRLVASLDLCAFRVCGNLSIRFYGRMGAQIPQVLFTILPETVVLAGLGIVVCLLVAASLTRNVQSMLYGLKPTDLFTLRGTFLVMLRAATLGAGGPYEERLDLIQWLLFGTNDRDEPAVNSPPVGGSINLWHSIVQKRGSSKLPSAATAAFAHVVDRTWRQICAFSDRAAFALAPSVVQCPPRML